MKETLEEKVAAVLERERADMAKRKRPLRGFVHMGQEPMEELSDLMVRLVHTLPGSQPLAVLLTDAEPNVRGERQVTVSFPRTRFRFETLRSVHVLGFTIVERPDGSVRGNYGYLGVTGEYLDVGDVERRAAEVEREGEEDLDGFVVDR